MKAVSKFRADQSGAGAIEFCIILPTIVLLLFGAVSLFGSMKTTAKGEKAVSVVVDMLSRRPTVDDAFLRRMRSANDHIASLSATGFRVTSARYDGSKWAVEWSWGSGTLPAETKTAPSNRLPPVAKNSTLIVVETKYFKEPFTDLVPNLGSDYAHFAFERPRYADRVVKQ